MATAKPVKKNKLGAKKLEKKTTLNHFKPLSRNITLTRNKLGL